MPGFVRVLFFGFLCPDRDEGCKDHREREQYLPEHSLDFLLLFLGILRDGLKLLGYPYGLSIWFVEISRKKVANQKIDRDSNFQTTLLPLIFGPL